MLHGGPAGEGYVAARVPQGDPLAERRRRPG